MVSILAEKATLALGMALETLALPSALGGPSHPPLDPHSLFILLATPWSLDLSLSSCPWWGPDLVTCHPGWGHGCLAVLSDGVETGAWT